MHMKVSTANSSQTVLMRKITTQFMLVSKTNVPIRRAFLINEQLFFRTGRLRIVISTANLVDYDWRDIENVRAASCAPSLSPI